jgi:uncharacterized protein
VHRVRQVLREPRRRLRVRLLHPRRVTERAFEAQYCERIEGHLSFKSRDRACIFLVGGRCSVYALRPAQCRTFPFWPELLADERAWERDVASFCPGVGQGPVRDANAIRAALHDAT